MGIDQEDTPSKSNLTLEIFQNIFADIDPNITIENFEETQGSSRGDNYTAALFRILLKGYVRKENDGKKLKWEKSLICKRLPDSVARREAYRSEALFRNEVVFYTTIIPEFLSFQKKKTKEIFQAIPHCFLARSDLVVLEDLCIKNFKMANRQEGLSLKQTETVLMELAKFHSLSLAYKAQYPTEFQKLTMKIDEGIFSISNYEWYRNYYKRLTKNAIEMVAQSFPDSESIYVKKLKEFAESETFFTRMIDLVKMESSLSVICHGDCWTNNLLYNYLDDGIGIDNVCFVDFQLIRHGSPALDIANLLFCCTNHDLRKNQMNNLLKLYHKELVVALKQMGPLPNFCGTEDNLWDKIQLEFKTFAKFGLGLAMDIIPISTCSSEEAPDLYMPRSDEIIGAPELNVPPNELCRQKMTAIVIDLVDNGFL